MVCAVSFIQALDESEMTQRPAHDIRRTDRTRLSSQLLSVSKERQGWDAADIVPSTNGLLVLGIEFSQAYSGARAQAAADS